MSNDPQTWTIAEAEEAGFPGLELRCQGRCGYIVQVAFTLMRRPTETVVADLIGSMRCKRCGTKPEKALLSNQYMAPGVTFRDEREIWIAARVWS